MSKPTAWIDADIILYRAASFCESEFDGDPAADWRQGKAVFFDILDRWLSAIDVGDYHLVFTGPDNFRKQLYPEYKANRKLLQTWPGMRPLKNELLEYSMSVLTHRIEADDLIGIKCSEDPKNTIAVSADKDFQTVPCKLFIPASHGKTKGQWVETSEPQANLNWMRQALTGDVTDNYQGIRGIGPAKAIKILPDVAPVSELWASVLAAFEAAGHNHEYAITMARLARILRHGEYDFDTKEIKLWKP